MPQLIRLTASDGTTVEFHDEIKAQGGVKDVYFNPQKQYVVAFYRKDLGPQDKERLKTIVGTYHQNIFNSTNGGLYWNGYPMTQIGFPDYSKYYPNFTKIVQTAPFSQSALFFRFFLYR